MSFFVKANRRSGGKGFGGKRGGKPGKRQHLPLPAKRSKNDEEITSDEEDLDGDPAQPVDEGGSDAGAGSDSELDETAEQKRLRLATKYLDEVRKRQDDEDADEEQRHSLIAHRLKRDVLEQSGRLFKPLARTLLEVRQEAVVHLKNQHRLPITRVVLSPDEKAVFSASKDGTLVRCCLSDVLTIRNIDAEKGLGQRAVKVKRAHAAAILALAISSDGRYLASGCAANVLTVWNPETLEKVHTFSTAQHRGKITGLAFRYGTHQLISCSADRSVKIWSLDEMAYVETLFGHEDAVTSVDSFIKDRALTSGGRDGTLRLWKIPEESQLVFQGNQSSADCCAMLNDEIFVSGHDDGRVYLWKAMKKKPVASATVSPAGQWVTAVGVVKSSDLVAAGSSCGYITVFLAANIEKGAEGRCALEEIQRIPCVGFVNSLVFSPSTKLLVAAVSQEHALGRWERLKDAKNAVQVIPLCYKAGDLKRVKS